MNGLRCPKCSRLVGDYDVEFEVRERPGRMDPVEGGDDETTA